MKTAEGRTVSDPVHIFDHTERQVVDAAKSPHAFALAMSLCDCIGVSCQCPNVVLESRAVLALLPQDQASALVEYYGLKVGGYQPLSREEARVALGPEKFHRLCQWIQQFAPAPPPAPAPLEAIPA